MPPQAPIASALDPTKGNNIMERYGPIVVFSATVLVSLAAIFGFVPGLDVPAGVAMLASAGSGYFVRSQA